MDLFARSNIAQLNRGWTDDAACQGSEIDFYSESFAAVLAAKRLCRSCPVLAQCQDWALVHEEFGIWGGTEARERARMRRERGISLDVGRFH